MHIELANSWKADPNIKFKTFPPTSVQIFVFYPKWVLLISFLKIQDKD